MWLSDLYNYAWFCWVCCFGVGLLGFDEEKVKNIERLRFRKTPVNNNPARAE
jgi:hypothetical protein